MVEKRFSFSFWLSVLHRFDQQMVAYPESANPDSVILILWYLDHFYPVLEVFEKRDKIGISFIQDRNKGD